MTSNNNISIYTSFRELLAGGLGGIADKLFEYPFDTVKVRVQTSNNKSTLHIIQQMYNTKSSKYTAGGVYAFFKGITWPMLMSAGEISILMFSYYSSYRALDNYLKIKNEKFHYKHNYIITPLAGIFSGALVTFYLTPVELVKCRLQAAGTSKLYKGPRDCIRDVIKHSGFRGLYTGFVSTLIREVPGCCIFYTVYEAICKNYINSINPTNANKYNNLSKEHLPMGVIETAGALAGVSYVLATHPIDVIKSKVQTRLYPVIDSNFYNMNSSFFRTFKSTYLDFGISGLFSGIGVSVFRTIPGSAALFLTYELVNKLMGKKD